QQFHQLESGGGNLRQIAAFGDQFMGSHKAMSIFQILAGMFLQGAAGRAKPAYSPAPHAQAESRPPVHNARVDRHFSERNSSRSNPEVLYGNSAPRANAHQSKQKATHGTER